MTIRLAMLGFNDAAESARLAALFTHARHWQQPWEVVEQVADAEFVLLAADDETTHYPPHFSPDNIILYANQPSQQAKWHLLRPANAQTPSPLDFTLLLKNITQSRVKSAPVIPVKTAAKSESLKVLIVGSVGSGKTTAVKTLGGSSAISTEAKPSDQTQLQKSTTTVAMDFGTLRLDDATQVRLYGSPGQRRFDFMGDILLHKAAGLIILIGNDRSDCLSELNYYLNAYHDFLRTHPAVIGVTHNDISPTPALRVYADFIQARGQFWPVRKVDARNHLEMKGLVDLLIETARLR
ncbi:hypothetical protein HMY34_03120 [Thiothrix subterranea]|uniref:GTP-binding protein n=1 Tax=Thiothrix subterranea TaxID=2735563 RepID=UPI00192C4910|nr:hypothetical protein [Thiothrix subterranea]QQZ27826.1 hypothetical protein HMY34_03120 [Thiothrix subterranea]